MERTAILIRPAARRPAAAGWAASLRDAWDELTLTDDERWLREARDPADVEWRLKRLERGRAERFGRLDPLA